VHPFVAQPTDISPRPIGIQIDKTLLGKIIDRLDKSVLVGALRVKYRAKRFAIVVIAKKQPQRYLKLIEMLPQVFKGVSLTPMGEIARDNAEISVTVGPIDVLDATTQRDRRISAIKGLTLRNKVRVCYVNEFQDRRTLCVSRMY